MTKKDNPCNNCLVYTMCRIKLIDMIKTRYLLKHSVYEILQYVCVFNLLKCKDFSDYIKPCDIDYPGVTYIYDTFNLNKEFKSIDEYVPFKSNFL